MVESLFKDKWKAGLEGTRQASETLGDIPILKENIAPPMNLFRSQSDQSGLDLNF